MFKLIDKCLNRPEKGVVRGLQNTKPRTDLFRESLPCILYFKLIQFETRMMEMYQYFSGAI